MSVWEHGKSIRPYQLACLVCRAGSVDDCAGDDAAPCGSARVAQLAELIRDNPDMPLTLCCNVGDVCAYQDPGPAEDTAGSAEFNAKRDLDILQWLDLAPGSTLPARILIRRLLLRMETVRGVCGYDDVTAPAWEGCPKADSGDYERGRELGVEAIIPPRPEDEMVADKQQSMAALEKGGVIPIRPHIVVCSVCQYGNDVRPPFAADNLPEWLQMVLEPGCELQVELVPGADWAMCAPCPSRSQEGCCVCGKTGSGGLYNVVKDLNVLKALGLTFGTVMNAREMYRLIFERIPTTNGVCALTAIGVPEHSIWKDGCSSMTFPGPYEKGREELMDRVKDE